MTRRVLGALLMGLGLVMGPAAQAVEGSSLELGNGESTDMARVTARWNWDKHWPVGRNWDLTGFWEIGLGYWQGNDAGGKNVWDLGLTPVFRLDSKHSGFYWEGAIGAHFLSHDRIDNQRVFGSRFSFGDHVGFGWRLGGKGRYELGYRFQHLSNANTAMPNDTINFHQIRLGFNY